MKRMNRRGETQAQMLTHKCQSSNVKSNPKSKCQK